MPEGQALPWIVAMTKPNFEAIAATNLERQGYTHYCPKYLQKQNGKEPTVRPLFPRYMFVFITDIWYSVRSTRGISHVLMGEGGPQKLADCYIDSLKKREDGKGLVQLAAPSRFNPGDKVRTDEGPFAGQLLIYEGMNSSDRVKVLVNLFGGQVRADVSEKSLVAA